MVRFNISKRRREAALGACLTYVCNIDFTNAPDEFMTAAKQNRATIQTYIDHVNPQWVRLLNLLQMQTEYTLCSGAELYTADGDVLLDFLSGYCVHNIGHNHPAVIDALHAELDRRGPAMLQSHVPDLAGDLAKRLCGLAGGKLEKAFFASSGSEGVEAAI